MPQHGSGSETKSGVTDGALIVRNEEEQNYSVEELSGATLLIERIEKGYRPEVNGHW